MEISELIRNNIAFNLALRAMTAIAILAAMLNLFQRRLIYFPVKYEAFHDDFFSEYGIEPCEFTASDGIKISGWFMKASDTAPVLLWCHGNAGNITHRLGMMTEYRNQGISVFIFDYRGYGRSAGSPLERGLYKDAQAAWEYLTVTRKISKERIVLFGQSLGGAVAVELAQHVKPDSLILQSTFTSIRDMAQKAYPAINRLVWLTEEFNSIHKIDKIQCPVLFIHGKRDSIIPWKFTEKLYEKCTAKKDVLYIPDADHNNLPDKGGEPYYGRLRGFVFANTK